MRAGDAVGAGLDPLRGMDPGAREVERLRDSSSLLESEFVATLFRVMRETVPQESPGADGAAEVFWSLMEREVADRFSLGGGYGLGQAVARSLSESAGLPPEAPE